jgi:hypothetical protein
VRQGKSWVYVVSLELGPEQVEFYKFSWFQLAESTASQINSALKRKEYSEDFRSTGGPAHDHLALHVEVDKSWMDECIVACLALVALLTFVYYPVSETLTINRECGVLVLERRTLYSSCVRLAERNLPHLASSHVVILTSTANVMGVEETSWTVTERNRTRTMYGVKLRLRDGRSVLLRMENGLENRAQNQQSLLKYNEVIQQAAPGHGCLGQIQTTGGGGHPGGHCVVCWERVSRIAFAPCAHVCCCEICGQLPELTACPVCSRPISSRIGLYFS